MSGVYSAIVKKKNRRLNKTVHKTIFLDLDVQTVRSLFGIAIVTSSKLVQRSRNLFINDDGNLCFTGFKGFTLFSKFLYNTHSQLSTRNLLLRPALLSNCSEISHTRHTDQPLPHSHSLIFYVDLTLYLHVCLCNTPRCSSALCVQSAVLKKCIPGYLFTVRQSRHPLISASHLPPIPKDRT